MEPSQFSQNKKHKICLFLNYALYVYATTGMVQLPYTCYMDLNFALSNLYDGPNGSLFISILLHNSEF